MTNDEILTHRPFAASLLKTYARIWQHRLPWDEAYAIALYALVKAGRTYRSDQGATFGYYYGRVLRNELVEEANASYLVKPCRHAWHGSPEKRAAARRATKAPSSLSTASGRLAAQIPAPDTQNTSTGSLDALLGILTPKRRRIVAARYGIGVPLVPYPAIMAAEGLTYTGLRWHLWKSLQQLRKEGKHVCQQ